MKLMDRSVPVRTDFEMRANASGGTDFTGYAALFDSDSEPMPFIETVAPGAFSRTLGPNNAHTFVMNHDDTLLLASTRSGRLGLQQDSRGLLTTASLPDTSYASDLRSLNAVGEVWGMSFTFRAAKNGEEWTGSTRRRLTDVALGHVTVLTGLQPAYPGTSGLTQIRALAKELSAEIDDLEGLFEAITTQRTLDDAQVGLLKRLTDHYAPRSLDDLAAFLLADRAALAAAIDKLANGEPLLAQEADMLEAAIDHLEPPDDAGMMEMNALPALTFDQFTADLIARGIIPAA